MANIDDFKANLIGGGARANQFRATITPPAGIAIGLDVRRASFLCYATDVPNIDLGTIELKYRGRSIQMAGDRDTTGDWTTEFYMDTDMMILNALQRWSNGINDFDENTGVITSFDSYDYGLPGSGILIWEINDTFNENEFVELTDAHS